MKEIMMLNKEPLNAKIIPDEKDREIERLNARVELLSKEMDQFSYIVSHDLQAPLRMITGFIELLEKKYSNKLDDAGRQYIGYAVNGAAKMKELVFALLEYSRLNLSKQEKTLVDLNEVMKEVQNKYAKEIEASSIKIYSDELPAVMADKKQMLQLLNGLFDNAVKFRNPAAPEIRIQAKKLTGKWEISIRDNGMGIDPLFFEKIFIIFRKLNNDEIKYPGCGAGLTACKKIVELHEGTIWLESEVEKGSTFYFTLPDLL